MTKWDILFEDLLWSFKRPRFYHKRCSTMILKILRHFHFLDKNILFTTFLQTTYKKVSELIPQMNDYMKFLQSCQSKPSFAFPTQIKYLRLFINNLVSLQKKCINSTMSSFNKLPGNIPLEIRNHIVGFIALAPTRF